MSLHSNILMPTQPEPTSLCAFSLMLCVLSGEVTKINFGDWFDPRPTGLEPTIYRTRGEHANYYAIDAVLLCL